MVYLSQENGYRLLTEDDYNIIVDGLYLLDSNSVVYDTFLYGIDSTSFILERRVNVDISSYSYVYTENTENITSKCLIRKSYEKDEYDNVNAILRIEVYRSPDSKKVIYDSINDGASDNSIVSGDVTRDVTEALSSASFLIDVADRSGVELVKGGDTIDVYADYEDRRMTVDLYEGLEFFMGEDNGSMINEVDE